MDTDIKPRKPHPEDYLKWPDGSWCQREVLDEYPHMSDDYEVVFVNTPEWEEFDAELRAR